MPIVNTLNTKSSSQYRSLCLLLKTHYLIPNEISVKIEDDFEPKNITSVLKKNKIKDDVIYIRGKQLYVFNNTGFKLYDGKSIKVNISKYIIENHQHGQADLSCRSSDLYLLDNLLKNGSPDFSKSPEKWIKKNPFFDRLRPRPFYNRLLAFNLDQRGMFLKIWRYRAQRNYFHPSVNSGLPLLKKDDPIHEGTFMMHDMFHHIFLDPIITGHENNNEKIVYIVCRMMSEACTLVLADMIAVAHSNIENDGYDITKRKIYPLFKSLNLNAFDIETVRKVLYANCVYVIFGDESVYKKLNCDKEALKLYTGKYENFFSGDFQWNYKNINNVLNEMKKYKGLQKYFKNLDNNYKSYNTKSLTRKITKSNGYLSFNILFEEFWKQLKNLIEYTDKANKTIYAKTGYLKFISGQIYIAFKFIDLDESKELVKEYKSFLKNNRKINDYKKIVMNGQRMIQKINFFIDTLFIKNLITEVEADMYKLHVPHFPALYLNYDKENFNKLTNISKKILEGLFDKEDMEYKPMNSKLRRYYFEIVGGKYEY